MMMDGMVKRPTGRTATRGFAARTVFIPGKALAPSLDAYAQARGLSKSETLRELLTVGLATQVATLTKGGAR